MGLDSQNTTAPTNWLFGYYWFVGAFFVVKPQNMCMVGLMASTLPNPADCCNCADGTTIVQSTLDAYITSQVTGSTVGYYVVDTLNAVRALSTQATNKFAKAWGNTVVTDGYISTWRWDATGTGADDGNNILRPDDYSSAGVWVRME